LARLIEKKNTEVKTVKKTLTGGMGAFMKNIKNRDKDEKDEDGNYKLPFEE